MEKVLKDYDINIYLQRYMSSHSHLCFHMDEAIHCQCLYTPYLQIKQNILREKINEFSVRETHYEIEIEKLQNEIKALKTITTKAKEIGLTVAPGGLKTKKEFQKMILPLVVKPNDEGSSCGVQIIKTEKDRKKVLSQWAEDKVQLVEKYIEGRELSVAVLKDQALTSVELCVKKGWYDYKNKYKQGAVIHVIPAKIPSATQRLILRQAEQIHASLGCRGVSRSDFRLSKTGKPYFLEINTNPGMTACSLVPDMAKARGISYEQVVEALIQEAQCD